MLGIDDPEPLRPEEGEGSPELRPEPPELDEEPPLEPPEDPPEDDGDELGEGAEGDDDCWLGQPPISNNETAPIAAASAATTCRRLRER